jgi:hypothetical protein
LKIRQTNLHLQWNGQVARIFLLSKELAQRGHEVAIACPAGSALAERAKAAGIPVFTGVRLQKANRLISFFRDVVALGRLGRAEAFDWLHTHGSQDTWATVCARWFFRLRAPILSTRHNTKPVRFLRIYLGELPWGSRERRLVRWLKKKPANGARNASASKPR